MKPQAFKLTRIRNAMNLPAAKGFGKALIGFGVLAVALSVDVHAGTDTTFGSMQTWLSNNLTGSMGKSFAIGSLAVGLGVGIVKQSIMSAAVGCGIALAASLGPGVLTGIFTATLL